MVVLMDVQTFFLPHLYNSDSFLENVDLQEVEAIHPHVTDTPRDFSDEFQEFAEFVSPGNDYDNMPSDVVVWIYFCI